MYKLPVCLGTALLLPALMSGQVPPAAPAPATRDQFYLRRAGATPEEILVRQRQLATGYRYYTQFSVSYSFGSIFNNIVNPRFGGGGDVFFFN